MNAKFRNELQQELDALAQAGTLKHFHTIESPQAPVVLLANPAVPARTVAELVAYAKANPGKLSYASGGVGASTHFAGVLFNLRAGVEIVHVPFRSSGPAVTAVLSNQVQLQYGGLSSARPYIEAGTLRALAVTGEQRWHDLPEVPTMLELGYPGFVSETFQGLFAPAGTPAPVIERLARETTAVLNEPTTRTRLLNAGFGIRANGPEGLAERVAREVPMWRDLIQRAGIPMQG